jgi:kynurenine formamidase
MVEPEWDRFPGSEGRGALNFIDTQKVVEAASLVKSGRTFPLNSRIDTPDAPVGRPALKRYARMHNTLRPVGDGRYMVFNDDVVEFALQSSSHLDAFAHAGVIEPGETGIYYGGAGLEQSTPDPWSPDLGIDSLGGAIVTRGVLLDTVAELAGEGAAYLPQDATVSADVIRACLARQDVELAAGDAVLLFTGYEDRLAETGGRTPQRVPGLNGSTLEIWRDSRIALIASDNLAVETFPVDYSIHIGALRNLGIPLGELWLLRELAEDCRRRGVWDFLLVSVPLNIHGAFGSPANAVAVT